MKFELEFLAEASEELETATWYYACTAVSSTPLHWNERKGKFRRVNLRGFPYYIAFFIRGNRILVAAVAHASRHPDYWKRRTVL
ncbi:MAG: hypothetical protein ACO1TE_10660 [Prosthecobacter sp.]